MSPSVLSALSVETALEECTSENWVSRGVVLLDSDLVDAYCSAELFTPVDTERPTRALVRAPRSDQPLAVVAAFEAALTPAAFTRSLVNTLNATVTVGAVALELDEVLREPVRTALEESEATLLETATFLREHASS
jgi:hypothetical protein